jgi:hypothetical protein
VQQNARRDGNSDGVQHAIWPAKSYYLSPTREAGLVQIAKSLIDRFRQMTGNTEHFTLKCGACRRFVRVECGPDNDSPQLA